MKRLETFPLLISSLLFLAGCSTPQYRFIPAGLPAEKVTKPLGEAVYSEPSQTPTGSVRVMSMGVVDFKPGKDAKKQTMLHVRMALSNKNAQEWVLDTAEQMVSYPDKPQVKPSYANSSNENLPKVVVKPQELRIVDLYYDLPTKEKSAKEIPQFDFHWKLMAGAKLVSESTLFDRVQVPEGRYYSPYDPYPYPGWGPNWWGGVGVGFHERF